MSDDYKYKNIYKSTLTEVKDIAGSTLRDAYRKIRGLIVESPPERSFSVFDAEEKLKKREKKILDEIGD